MVLQFQKIHKLKIEYQNVIHLKKAREGQNCKSAVDLKCKQTSKKAREFQIFLTYFQKLTIKILKQFSSARSFSDRFWYTNSAN